MKILNLLDDKLSEVYAVWKFLDHDKKKQKINLVLPFIQISSFLQGLGRILEQKNEHIDEILKDFADFYQKSYGADLAKMSASDLSPEIMQEITEAQEKGVASEELLGKISQYQEKYTHAHNRIMFNYGDFLLKVFPNLHQDEQRKILNKLKEVSQASRADDATFNVLLEINKFFELEKNSQNIEKDDLENHAFLNQMTKYMQNLQDFLPLLTKGDKFKEICDSFESDSRQSITKKSIERRDDKISSDFLQEMRRKGLEMQIGIESEFVLNTLAKKSTDSAKEILADLNARRKMQTKYGLEPSVAGIEDMTIFLQDNPDLASGFLKFDVKVIKIDILIKITDENWREIKDLIDTNSVALIENKGQLINFINQQIDKFSQTELYFYKLFLIENFAKDYKVEVDGVFDPNKSIDENSKNILALIGKGRFHEKLLDMIRANEISFGPFDVRDIIQKKNQLLQKMEILANRTGLSMDDANIQINISLKFKGRNIFLPVISQENGKTTMKTNKLAQEILGVIEEAVAKSCQEQGVLRDQSEIKTVFDRKKVIGEELIGTEFLDIDPKLNAFLNHKKLAAKNATLRLSKINDQVAVVEIRLIGNNTHFKDFDSEQKLYQPGIKYILEDLMPLIAAEIAVFLKSTPNLSRIYDQDVSINPDGSISGLDSVKVGELSKINPYDSSISVAHRPTRPLQKIGSQDDISLKPLRYKRLMTGPGLSQEV